MYTDVKPVPLPASVWMLISGLGPLAIARFRRRQEGALPTFA
jgi:hypothetical protein